MNTTRFFRPLVPALLLAATLVSAQAQTRPAVLVPQGSEIVFTTRQMGVPVEGRFGKFAAHITLDPRQPQAGTVMLEIDTGSARFGSAELDAEVPKRPWLDAAGFPKASFQSTAIKAAGPGRYEVAGKLLIKGAASNLTVPVQLVAAGARSVASGSFTIQRLAFKVGDGEWADTSMVANDVQVRFKLVLEGLPTP